MSGQEDKPKRPAQRYRISGTPSKLGCVTCKIRRVKCGEEKPFCLRCTSTGRKCDGYVQPPPTRKHSSRNPTLAPKPGSRPRSPSRTRSTLHPSNPEDSLEAELFDFFCSDTVKSLSQSYWPNFWQSRVLQTSEGEPSVRHAVIAIAALHRDLELTTAGVDDGTMQHFAFKEYTKAISHLHRMMSNPGPQSQKLDITLISCILFVCFDFLVGNHSSAIVHLIAGLKIVNSLHNPSTGTIHQWKTEFAPILFTLGVDAAIFIEPLARKRATMHALIATLGLPCEKSVISSIEDGKYKLNMLNAQAINCETALDAEQWHSDFRSWSEAFHSFISRCASSDSRWHRTTLLLQISALAIFATMCQGSVRHEAHVELLGLCEEYISLRSNTPSIFSMTHDIVHPLFITALFASDLSLQMRILKLLRQTSGREGTYSPDVMIKILENMIYRGEQLPLVVMETNNIGDTTDRNKAIWAEALNGLQGKMEWVREDSPSGDDVIEVGRFEGTEFETGIDPDIFGVINRVSEEDFLDAGSSRVQY